MFIFKAKVFLKNSTLSKIEMTEQVDQGQSSFRNWLENEKKQLAQQYSQQIRKKSDQN